MQILLSLLAIILFIGLILVHEWGHYKAARRNGVGVEEYGLGFPPRAWGKKLKSGMVLSLNWLPLGGFVKLKGENDSDTRKGSFGAASLAAKTKIMVAGVAANLVVGLILLTILAVIGIPKVLDKERDGVEQFTVASDTKVVGQEVRAGFVEPGSPADRAGLSRSDIIERISAGNEVRIIRTDDELKEATSYFAGKTVEVTYKDGNKTITRSTLLLSEKEVSQSQKTDNPKGYLGVVPLELSIQRSTWSAPVVALGFTKQLVQLTIKGIGNAFSGLGSTISGLVTGNREAREHGQAQASSQVGGPIAIAATLWGSGSFGINFILMIIAVLSLTLALINILPIPALDGGRLALILFSRGLLKRPLKKETEEKIVGTGMAVLLGLIVLITIVDVKRFF